MFPDIRYSFMTVLQYAVNFSMFDNTLLGFEWESGGMNRHRKEQKCPLWFVLNFQKENLVLQKQLFNLHVSFFSAIFYLELFLLWRLWSTSSLNNQ